MPTPAGPDVMGTPAWPRRACNIVLVLCGNLILAQAASADEPVTATVPSPTPSPQFARFFPIIRSEQDWHFLANPANRSDPYDGLEYVPLSAEKSDWYASFGAESRLTDERIGNDYWNPNPSRNGSFQQRYLFISDLHFGPNLRAFIETKSDFANGRIGGNRPIDGDDVDFVGLFVEAKVGNSAASPTVRVGREELLLGSQRLVSPREGPNVRQSFTGIRAQNTLGAVHLDALAVHPDKDASTFFADAPNNATSLWGLYSTTSVGAVGVDAYYLGLHRDAYLTVRGTDDETRHTFGLRADRLFSARSAGLDFDDEVMYQSGRFGSRPIAAWSVGTVTGWHFGSAPIAPHLTVKADVASGDDPKRNSLGTFDPYFPRGDYFGVLATTGPIQTNFVDLHPAISTTLGRLTATADLLWYWRESLGDGLYSTSGTVIRQPMGSSARFVGQQPGVELFYQIDFHAYVQASYGVFEAGPFIRETGPASPITYRSLELGYKF